MENKIKLSVIIPSFLEEDNLKQILPRINNVLTPININYDILVVDAILPLDKTKEICEQNKARYINRENSNSFGAAVRTGINYANGEYILFMDADGSHPPEFISSLYQYVDEYDIVIASRYVEGGATENNEILILMSKIVNAIYSLVLNIRCKDISNSFRVYRAQLLKRLKLSCNNFDIIEEILFKIVKNKKDLKIKEVPFTFKKRMFGKTKRNLLLFMASYLFTLLKLKYGK